MRKLKLQVQMTVDGFVGEPNGEIDWLTFSWDEELVKYVTELTESMGLIVLGRNLAQGFIPHWAAVAQNPEHGEHLAGIKFTDTPKVVFSKTLEASAWENTVLASGDLVEEINRLKQQDVPDIIAYGGANFVSNLIKHNLIDEYHLFVNPAAIGSGLPIFQGLDGTQKLNLVKATPCACGIVVLHYEPKRS